MDRSDFSFDLPPELIAQTPLAQRSASRLLVLEPATGALEDRRFGELPQLLAPGDLLVLNDTRVLPARLHGRKATGGRIELLLERLTAERSGLFQIRASRSPKPGSTIVLDDGTEARVTARDDDLFEVELDRDLAAYLEACGQIPLPPYIQRSPDAADAARYQTVFARAAGAVAAPTAGLHFDAETFAALERRGIERAFLTLHVGAGTFAPLREANIESNLLHAEHVDVGSALCEQVAETKRRGGRVVAVGTTVVRALETAAREGQLAPYAGETRLFIYPGYEFRVVDAIVTNFHLPESSLLMLVAAFAGRDETLRAYRHAVAEGYRFFSYGDAMFISGPTGTAARG